MPLMNEPKIKNWSISLLTLVCTADSTHPLIAKFAVAVISSPLDRKGHGADDQGPFRPESVDNGASEHTDYSQHGVVDGVAVA